MTPLFRNGLAVALAVIILDQITKLWAVAALGYATPAPVLPSFNLTLMHNPGAAFSFLGDAGGWQRWFFLALATGVSTWLILWMRGLQVHERWTGLALALLLGGAIGNAIDRAYLGHVIDFIDLYWGAYHWPAFNIADAAITVGAILLFVMTLREGKKDKTA
ncbi:MAG: lipoprotein signal peptidase [Halothiobacillaceae bacterium]|nr:MAG: lipoprotein signal peptidase [Halothiobacillaceae bacterium]